MEARSKLVSSIAEQQNHNKLNPQSAIMNSFISIFVSEQLLIHQPQHKPSQIKARLESPDCPSSNRSEHQALIIH
jgi:hypothetical protein